MLVAITQLLVCQLIGEVIARGFDLAIPGPVIGMGLLLLILFNRRAIRESPHTTHSWNFVAFVAAVRSSRRRCCRTLGYSGE
jgi:Putative effector of murein hydrolase LrgA